MDPVFIWIEGSALSMWLRYDLWAFPLVLILHTVGLAFLVGANVAINARVLGLAAGVPLYPLERYFLVAWAGFWINAASGIFLLIAYPTKALTNPLFYAKLILIGAGVGTMLVMRRSIRESAVQTESIIPSRLKLISALSLACWTASIVAGRLLAYTYSRLTVIEFL